MILDNPSTDIPTRDRDQTRPISVVNGLGFDSEKARWAMQEVKAFLDPYRKYIHSLMIIKGSLATTTCKGWLEHEAEDCFNPQI